MSGMKGYTKLDGSPADGVLPEGVADMAAIGEETEVDRIIQAQLEDVYESELNKAKARFKLEVSFMEPRRRMGPYLGVICIWTNGGFSHGGGDEVVYLCTNTVTDKEDQKTTCGAPIDLKFVSHKVAVCEQCKGAVNPKELTGQIIAKLSSQNWARLMTKVFARLEGNADIRMGFMEGSLRIAAEAEQAKQQHGDHFYKVRDERSWVNYPLNSIIKDVSTGSSLYKRIRIFLEA